MVVHLAAGDKSPFHRAVAHSLQTQIAEGAKSFLGSSDASTATRLTQQWAETEEALDAEFKILGDCSALHALHECARGALDVAHDLGSYLARAKDEYSDLDFPKLAKLLQVFPELVSDGTFRLHLENAVGLPLSVDHAARDHGSLHMMVVEEASLPDLRRLSLNAVRLHESNAATPAFVLLHGKLWAKYVYNGLSLSGRAEPKVRDQRGFPGPRVRQHLVRRR